MNLLRSALSLYAALAVLLPLTLHAETSDLASLRSAEGSVLLRDAGGAAWGPALIGTSFQPRDAVKTGAASRAGVRFNDGVMVRLNELSELQFKEEGGETTRIGLAAGEAYFFTRAPRDFPVIETEHVSAAIRGTEFVVAVRGDQTVVSVLEGRVEASNQFGTVVVNGGEQMVAAAGQAPVKQILVRPLDAVQWALYYPAVLQLGDYASVLRGAADEARAGWAALEAGKLAEAEGRFAGSSPLDHFGRSLARYLSGDLAGASEMAGRLPAEAPPAMLLYRAALSLAAGQVGAAEGFLAGAERRLGELPAEDRDALAGAVLAQRSVIAVTALDREGAKRLAVEATERAPRSSAAALARSYAAQSAFDLTEAQTWAAWAIELAPGDPVARARAAEIELAFGDVAGARALIEGAPEGARGDARLQTVSGFTFLSQNEPEAARAEFEEAVRIDSASGLARLGLGLAVIREGDLAGGREALELAAHLEPTTSLYRSYLAKAFFEERHTPLALREIERAKELDPLDPTPYLYGSYAKLSAHRPVEALWEVEDSIRLNDNRAVYRSSLLLDQDLAVRSIGLANSFTSIGFREVARREAIKSLQHDYSNYSAHLLLFNSFPVDPARFSEALLSEFSIANLLIPINYNFVTPSTSGAVSFNEYGAVFDRPHLRTSLEGNWRNSEDLLGAVATTSGATGRFSYVLSWETDYIRHAEFDPDWPGEHNFGGRFQYQPVYTDTFSFTSLFGSPDEGDYTSENIRAEDGPGDDEVGSTLQQIGHRHQFGPGSLLISQALYNRTEGAFPSWDVPYLFVLTPEQNGQPLFSEVSSVLTDRVLRQKVESFRVDSQYIRDADVYGLIAGVGYVNADVERENDALISPNEETFTASLFALPSSLDSSEEIYRGYLYGTLQPSKYLDLTAGTAAVRFEYNDRFLPPFDESERTLEKVLPKVGASFYPVPEVTVRGAWYRAVGITGAADIGSIEPTLVNGFNQAIVDIPGTVSENTGVGLDYKVAKSTYVGSEYLHRELDRDLNVGFDNLGFDVDTGEFSRTIIPLPLPGFTGEEEIVRSYLYQVLSSQVTATVEHTWSSFDTDRLDSEGALTVANLDTHAVELGLRWFLPSGFFVQADGDWYQQRMDNFADGDGRSDFWILSAALGYEFPERYGRLVVGLENLLDEDFEYMNPGLADDLTRSRTLFTAFSVTF